MGKEVWAGKGDERENSAVMRFQKKEEPVNLVKRPIQLASEIHSLSPVSHLHRCVATSQRKTPVPPTPLSLLHSLDNTTRSVNQMLAELGQSTERQQADSKIISHLRLILFKEKESSKAPLHTVAKKGRHTPTHPHSD